MAFRLFEELTPVTKTAMNMLNLVDHYNYIVKPHITGAGSNRLRDPFTSLWWRVAEELLQLVSVDLLKKESLVILDYGGGTGHKSANVASSFLRLGKKEVVVDYYDLNLTSCDNAQKLYNSLGIDNTIIKSVDNIVRERYDLVIFSEVYEHFPLDECDRLTRDIVERLKPGGFLFLTTPNYYGRGPAEESSRYYTRRKCGHYKHYKPEEVLEHFSSLGMKCLGECYSGKKTTGRCKFQDYWYPFYRFDERLYRSRRLPNALRKLYYYCSHPFWVFLDLLAYQYLYNRLYSDYIYVHRKNSMTMSLLFQKEGL